MKFEIALKRIKSILGTVKLTQEQLQDKSLIQYDTDEITPGEVVYLCDGASDWSVLPDGIYTTMAQVKFTITDGVVTDVDHTGEIKKAPEPNPLPQGGSVRAAADSLDNNKPGENDGTPKATDKNSTPGKGAIDLTEDNPAYGNVEYADPGYQKDKKKRYPIDTEEHIRAAWNYINKGKNADQYKDGELSKVKDKIIAAWKKKIDKDGPPSAQKHEMEKSQELIDAEAKLAEAQELVNKLLLASDVVNPPAAGAPEELLNPSDPVTQQEFAAHKANHALLQESHYALQAAHQKLRDDHEALSAKCEAMAAQHKMLADSMEEMGKAFKAASDDIKLSKTKIETLSKQSSAAPIEEVRAHKNVAPEISGSKAYAVFNSK